MNDLKSELSGNLEDCLLALLEPSALYDAKCLRRAMRVSVDQTGVLISCQKCSVCLECGDNGKFKSMNPLFFCQKDPWLSGQFYILHLCVKE